MMGIGLQNCPCIKTALGKCNLIIEGLLGRPSLDTVRISVYITMNGASSDMYIIEPTSIHK